VSVSLGMACNFYREPHALPGLLENASAFFDDLLFISTPPTGAKPDDESIAIIEKWGAKILYDTIDSGFGVIRTRLLHESTTEWAMLMDCDERFLPLMPVLMCSGGEKYPEVARPDLKVTIESPSYNHGRMLRSLIENQDFDCIRALRRHWFDFSMQHPCENWVERRDWQCRILRNRPNIGFKPEFKMHEKVWDFSRNAEPRMWRGEDPLRSIFYEHYHCLFKPMEGENNKEDAATYEQLEKGATAGMWLGHQESVKQ